VNRRRMLCLLSLALLLATGTLHPGIARAQISLSVYGVHMDPSGKDAKDFSSSSFGGGVHTSFPVPTVGKFIAGSAGIELVSMFSETHEFRDSETGLRAQQETKQDYFRLYLGPEFGPRGPGFFRPHLGVHLAFVNYGISTDVVVPDDVDRENEIRQSLRSEHRPTVGYDLTAAADFNFGKWFMVGGTRFSKSFNVPQQLGEGAVTIHPGYFQIYVGVGANLTY
jgi:hypothetical protein